MPDGKVHFAINLVVDGTIILPMAIYLAPESPVASGALLVGGFIGTFLTPDIDQETSTLEENRIKKINPILGKVYQLLWLPYAKRIPHRSISHWIVIGTLTRFLYIYLLYGILCLLSYPLIALPLIPTSNVLFVFFLFGGWTTVDSFHILADILFKSYYRVWYYRFHPGEKPKDVSTHF